MQTLTERVFKLNPPGGLIDSTVIDNLLPNQTNGARKLMLHRAVRSGEIIRVRQGLYCLAHPFRRSDPHPFVVAAAIHGPSYISLETALAHHGFIPEAVHPVASVTTQRSREYRTSLGLFTYYRIPSSKPRAGVRATELEKDRWAFVATPSRALVDLVYLRRISWKTDGLAFLEESMRLEEEELTLLDTATLDLVLSGIRSRRTVDYFTHLKQELGLC